MFAASKESGKLFVIDFVELARECIVVDIFPPLE